MFATHGPLTVVMTTSIQPIDLVAWARDYARAVIAIEMANDGSAVA